MVEHQSCASLVNASALCAIEQDLKGEGMSSIAEISAELQREKLRNAQLIERISVLEAQIQERNNESLPADGQGCCENTEAERRIKKFKRQRVEARTVGRGYRNSIKIEVESQVMHDSKCVPPKDRRAEDHLVNWMSMDETQFLHFGNLKESDSIAECNDTDESDDDDNCLYGDDDMIIDHKDCGSDENQRAAGKVHERGNEKCTDRGTQIQLESSSAIQITRTLLYESQGKNNNLDNDCSILRVGQANNGQGELKKHDRKETKKTCESKAPAEVLVSAKEVSNTGSVSIPHSKKPPKVAFCPKEVKRIMESEELKLKNAQSHTIRKIVVFASLGIRHGCEDMYDLDFNHFSILSKGEPYVSPKNPGEHVLYENPGGRRKIFYPNRENPTLCPVQILEEEKDMRPSDATCPSCLFLCIKYGGRTRNLPQNEYVRQRMGRNKLKSFGPVMCRMAMLVNVRSGSFFFKALGITLLFMAGFPDDLVQRETKYHNLDLLQKYYRRDEDTDGEELFLRHPMNYDCASIGPRQLGATANSTKPKSKKQTHSITNPQSLPKPLSQQSGLSSSTSHTQFGLMSFNSVHTQAMASFPSLPSQAPSTNHPIPNPMITTSGTNLSYSNQNPYHLFPPQPTNAFMPMMFWPPPNAFPPCPYPSSYGFRSFPSTGNYITIHPQPYYSHASSHSLVPEMVEGSGKNDVANEESDSDSNSSSEQRPTEPSCKQ